MDGIVVFAAATIPIYVGLKLNNVVRSLAITLALFVIIHGIYHIVTAFGYELLGGGFFEPLSIIGLIIFGYINLARRKEEE
ncbi:MAG: hypothetical protein M3530_01845 [Thermoproteota archaeon]|nr:hypothetical protein [Thermoproteota archaeon]